MFSRPWPSIQPRSKAQPQPQPKAAEAAEHAEQGGCECGDVVVRLLQMSFRDDGPQGRLCHCFRCRQMAGSHYRHNITVLTTQLVIEGVGALKCYADVVVPGQTSYTYFCARCGCNICTRDAETPGSYHVPLGLFDDTPYPAGELLMWQKVSWLRDKFSLKELSE